MAQVNEVSEHSSKMLVSTYEYPKHPNSFGNKTVLFNGLFRDCSKEEFLEIAGKWYDGIANITDSVGLGVDVHYRP